MFYAANLGKSRTNIDRVSGQNILSRRRVVMASLRVDRAVTVKGKILPGQVNLSNLKKQLV
jgi:hypothetical protein